MSLSISPQNIHPVASRFLITITEIEKTHCPQLVVCCNGFFDVYCLAPEAAIRARPAAHSLQSPLSSFMPMNADVVISVEGDIDYDAAAVSITGVAAGQLRDA